MPYSRSFNPLFGRTSHRNRTVHPPRRTRGPSNTVELGKQSGQLQKRIEEPPIENRVEVSAVERPAVEPLLRITRQQDLQMPSRWCYFTSNGRVHPVIVVKHRRGAQELQRPNEGVPQNVGYCDRSPSESDLDEDHADLRKRRERERRFGIGAGAA